MDPQNKKRVQLIYVLHLVGALVWPVLLISVILAYLERRSTSDKAILKHIANQIRVFWIHFVAGAIGVAATGIGFVVILSLVSVTAVARAAASPIPVEFSYVVFFLPLSLLSIGLITYVIVQSVRGLSRLSEEVEPDSFHLFKGKSRTSNTKLLQTQAYDNC